MGPRHPWPHLTAGDAIRYSTREMKAPFRAVLLAVALLSSGALQVAAAFGEDECCSKEESVPCRGLPLGGACPCCPSNSAACSVAPDVAPRASFVAAIAIVVAEPRLCASIGEIFQPPRA